jgi:hypothetical protein
MITSDNKGTCQFTTDTYRLSFPSDRPFIDLQTPGGERLAELFILSSIHALHGRDDTTRIGSWEVEEEAGMTTFLLRTESSLWKKKQYRLRCHPNRFTYDVQVEGRGCLAEVNYFGGYYSGQPRWGSGFFWSGQRFRNGFNPEPNKDEAIYFSPEVNTSIDLMGVPLPGRDNWFFTPPPFCYAMQIPEGWLSLGVETRPGQNRFTEYAYHGRALGFYLSLAYDGQTTVNGVCQLPAIGFDFAGDEYAALKRHVEALSVDVLPQTTLPREPAGETWWHTPIFCGWGGQSHLASSQGGRAPEYARQEVYEQFLQTLDGVNVDPGIIVLDDKWQSTYGENYADETKWPDLHGFVARQHARGRKVLLWLKAWDPEGVPEEECIRNASCLPVGVDPSNPAFERRLRSAVKRMLSPLGYGADGFKIDFTARIPCGPNLTIFGDTWGLELMHLYLSILHSEAKRIKPEALIMAHTPHPYLQDVVDMIRLNDINGEHDVNRAMLHRYRVASIACPNTSIDTDDWPMPDRASWRAYTSLQPELGVPSLYYVTHIDSTGEALDADDYRLIRESWARYREKQKMVFSKNGDVRTEEKAGGLSVRPSLLLTG